MTVKTKKLDLQIKNSP